MYVFLSFDFDADSAESLYYVDKPVKKSLARFAVRKGLIRVLMLLRKFGIKTTFFVPGWVVENYPDLVSRIVADGHELGMHGYQHERLYEYSLDDEMMIHQRAKKIIIEVQGYVYGFRKPYFEMSPNTLSIVSKLGIIYDSSLMDDDEPYIFRVEDREIVELPIYDMFDDWILFEVEHRSPREVLDMWIYELESALQQGLEYFCLILHPSCIGRASRIRILEEFILYAKKNRCSFSRGIDIARKVLQSKITKDS